MVVVAAGQRDEELHARTVGSARCGTRCPLPAQLDVYALN